jgi:transcriptional regulator of acetoin/glycerol metabolism
LSTQKVVFGVARRAAERLEMRYFEELFRKFYILSVANDRAATAMIAVDEDFCIVGATKIARQQLLLNESAVGSRSLWAVFERWTPAPSLDKLREGVQLRQLSNGQWIDIRVRAPLEPPRRSSALARQPATQSRRRPAGAGNPTPTVDECAGQDPKMLGNIGILRRVEGSGLHILLLGETGVGKDALARALHVESRRSDKPFVAFNCASVPETLVDSELFGYSAGAFTGASREGYVGRVVEADAGTLFLDEIGDMPISLQTRLLRVLESGEVSPLGSTKTRHVDLQVIAATHQNLVERMRDGRFRQDLFYRLAGAVVTIPPLRDRADLQHLINSVLRQSARGQSISFSAEAMQALIRHEWPGNIRELRNVIQRAVHFAVDGVVGTDALDAGGIFLADNRGMTGAATHSEHAVIFSPQPLGAAEEAKQPARREGEPIRARVAAEDAERQAIAKAIDASGRNPTLCAQMLGLSRATLYRKLKRHGLSSG